MALYYIPHYIYKCKYNHFFSISINYHEVNRLFCQVFPYFITFLSYVMAQKVMCEFDYPACQLVY